MLGRRAADVAGLLVDLEIALQVAQVYVEFARRLIAIVRIFGERLADDALKLVVQAESILAARLPPGHPQCVAVSQEVFDRFFQGCQAGEVEQTPSGSLIDEAITNAVAGLWLCLRTHIQRWMTGDHAGGVAQPTG